MLLVTGALGHSGQWFFNFLENSGYNQQIRCIIRDKKKILDLKKKSLNIEFVFGDLSDTNLIEKSLRGVHTVLHIAGINYSENIVSLGKKKGVEWYILVHTTGRFSKFRTASSKYADIEDRLIKQNSNLTILRPTMIYGSQLDQNIWRLINFLNNSNFFPVFGKGNNLLQPVHAKDLGRAYLNVLLNKKQTLNNQYNLSGKSPLTYNELLQTVSKKLDKKTIFIHIPISLSLLLAKIYNLILPSKAIVSVEQVMRMNEDKNFDHYKATKDFGFSPIGFEEGIDLEVKDFLKAKSN